MWHASQMIEDEWMVLKVCVEFIQSIKKYSSLRKLHVLKDESKNYLGIRMCVSLKDYKQDQAS